MKKKAARPKRTDFREFLFTATGKETDLAKLDALDIQDNLDAELDRLAAIADLLGCSSEHLETQSMHGLGLLLDDIRHRMKAILTLVPRARK